MKWLWLLAALILVVNATLFWGWTADDAFITFRYSENLARYGYWGFNPGEPPAWKAEGFSSLLWMLMLAGMDRLGVPTILAAKSVGLIAAVLCIWLMARVVGDEWDMPGRVGPLAMALSLPVYLYAVSGMELAFHVLLLVTFTALYGRSQRDCRYGPLAGACLGLALLSRPEAVLVLAAVWLHLAYQILRGTTRPNVAIWLVGLPLVVAGMLLAWRLRTYGDWLPNTYYAKAFLIRLGSDTPWLLWIGFKGVVAFLLKGGAIWLVPLAIWGLAHRLRAVHGLDVFFALMVGMGVSFQIWTVYDGFPYWRFGLYWLPFLAMLNDRMLSDFIARDKHQNKCRHWRRAVVALAISAYALTNYAVAWQAQVSERQHGPTWIHSTNHIAFGQWLARTLQPDTVLVTNEVGAIPYFAGLPAIDMLGLTDRVVARLHYEARKAGRGFYDISGVVHEILNRQPDAVILPSFSRLPNTDLSDYIANEPFMHPFWFAFLADPGFRACYRFASDFKIHDRQWENVFMRHCPVAPSSLTVQ